MIVPVMGLGLQRGEAHEMELDQPGMNGWHGKNLGGENWSRPSEVKGLVPEKSDEHGVGGIHQNSEN